MRDSDVCTQFRFEVAARFVTGHRVCPCHRDLLTSKLICVSYVCRTTFRPNVHGGAEKNRGTCLQFGVSAASRFDEIQRKHLGEISAFLRATP